MNIWASVNQYGIIAEDCELVYGTIIRDNKWMDVEELTMFPTHVPYINSITHTYQYETKQI